MNILGANKFLEAALEGHAHSSKIEREDEGGRWEDSRVWESEEMLGGEEMEADAA